MTINQSLTHSLTVVVVVVVVVQMDDVRCASRCHASRDPSSPIGRRPVTALRRHLCSCLHEHADARQTTEDDGRTRDDDDDDDDEREDGQSQCVDIGVETKVPSAVGVEKQGATNAFERAWSCLFTHPMRFNPPCGCIRCTDLDKKSRIARHDSTKKKPKNCAGR